MADWIRQLYASMSWAPADEASSSEAGIDGTGASTCGTKLDYAAKWRQILAADMVGIEYTVVRGVAAFGDSQRCIAQTVQHDLNVALGESAKGLRIPQFMPKDCATLMRIFQALSRWDPYMSLPRSYLVFGAYIFAMLRHEGDIARVHEMDTAIVLRIMYQRLRLDQYYHEPRALGIEPGVAPGVADSQAQPVHHLNEDVLKVLEIVYVFWEDVVNVFHDCEAHNLLADIIGQYLVSLLTCGYDPSKQPPEAYAALIHRLIDYPPNSRDPRKRLRWIVACIIGRHARRLCQAGKAGRNALSREAIKLAKNLDVDKVLLKMVDADIDLEECASLLASAWVPAGFILGACVGIDALHYCAFGLHGAIGALAVNLVNSYAAASAAGLGGICGSTMAFHAGWQSSTNCVMDWARRAVRVRPALVDSVQDSSQTESACSSTLPRGSVAQSVQSSADER